MVFRVTRGPAVDLAEAADVVERDRGMPEVLVVGIHRLRPGEVQDRPEQHRGVAVRQHEAVAVGPDRVLRIEVHHPVPERVDQRRERHRRAGVAGLGRLHRVDREGADRVDRRVESSVRHGHCLSPVRRGASSALGAGRPSERGAGALLTIRDRRRADRLRRPGHLEPESAALAGRMRRHPTAAGPRKVRCDDQAGVRTPRRSLTRIEAPVPAAAESATARDSQHCAGRPGSSPSSTCTVGTMSRARRRPGARA